MSKSRYFFYFSGSPIWAELVKELEPDSHAAFGLCDDRLIPLLKEVSPDSQVIPFNTLKFGLFSRVSASAPPKRVTQSSEFLARQDQAYYSIDRATSSGYISTPDRRLIVSSMTDHLWTYFCDFDPEYGIMSEAPHTLPDLLMAGIAEALKLPVVHFQGSSIVPAARAYLGPGYVPVHLSQLTEGGANSERLTRLEEFRGSVRGAVERASSVQSTASQADLLARTPTGPRALWRSVYSPYSKLSEERSKIDVSTGQMSPGRQVAISTLHGLHGGERRIRLWKNSVGEAWAQRKALREILAAHEATSARTLPSEFAAFFLQYEPERTSLPDGGRYSDQLRAVRATASELDGILPIVVKEHPSQFLWTSRGFSVRRPRFYKELAAIPNVLIGNSSIPSEAVLNDCSFAVTLTGSVGFEMRALGKPSIALGSAWYQGIPGIFCANGTSDVGPLLSQLLRWEEPPQFDLEESVMDLFRADFLPLATNPSVRTLFPSAEDHLPSLVAVVRGVA